MTTGEKVQLLRKRERLSQTKLAEALGIKQSRMSTIERDEGEPLNEQLLALSRFFKVPIEYLIDPKWTGPYDPAADAPRRLWEVAERIGFDAALDRVLDKPARRVGTVGEDLFPEPGG